LKKTELNSYRDAHPELINEFDKQLTELKQNYSSLLPQLKDVNKRDIVLQAVIENLQMQVNILNQQIEIINQLKTQQNETNNPIQL
jgi:chromosome segregation ATPase